MATEDLVNVITLPADGDESSEQYTFYKVDADGRVDQCTSNNGTELPIGILQNKPAAEDRGAAIATVGCVSKLVASTTINEGDKLRPDATGRGVVTTTDTHYYGAIALTASGATNDVIEVLVTGPQMVAG